MTDIVSVFRELPHFFSLNGTDDSLIKNTETALAVNYSDEYYAYLKEFGVASAGGHELTGICNSPRLNVVDVTIYERAANPNVPKDWYVIEQANIDGIVIWQNQNGEVFQTQPNQGNIKIANSIVEYLSI